MFCFFSSRYKNFNPKEIEKLEKVRERHKKVIEKVEIERINKIKELKELETIKKELRELKMEKINETIAIIPKEILFSDFIKYFLLVSKSSKRKKKYLKNVLK